MNPKPFAVLCVSSALLALGALIWFGSSPSGMVTYYDHRDNPYISFEENMCGEGYEPILVQETRFGTGKTRTLGCLEAPTTIHSSAVPFPPIRQRYRQPRLRRTYY